MIDPLAMSVCVDSCAAQTTLSTVAALSKSGVHTLLGISNVSFGLPMRDSLNASFFSMALFTGLSVAIVNPNSAELQKAYRAYLALSGLDENFTEYIKFAARAAGERQRLPSARLRAAGAPVSATAPTGTARRLRALPGYSESMGPPPRTPPPHFSKPTTPWRS